MHESFHIPYQSDKVSFLPHTIDQVVYYFQEAFLSTTKAILVKLLSIHPFNAFKFINLNTVDNCVKLVEPGYNGVSTFVVILSHTTLTKFCTPTSRIMFFTLSSIVESTNSCVSTTVGVSTNSLYHIRVV